MMQYEDSEEFVTELLDNNYLVHWHNQWDAIPDEGSPYQMLLALLENKMQKRPYE